MSISGAGQFTVRCLYYVTLPPLVRSLVYRSRASLWFSTFAIYSLSAEEKDKERRPKFLNLQKKKKKKKPNRKRKRRHLFVAVWDHK